MEQQQDNNINHSDVADGKTHKYLISRFADYVKDRFDLDADRAPQTEVYDNISKGVEFKGVNLWILIFATMVASLGLNVNSTAVIIGAMLISPLMGPIMGIGFALGINNFELMKRSLRNFGFMVGVGIITSTVFFYISPLSTAQSELLARTQPTTYDVLIAFFGGLAGMIAQTRKDRNALTVIPGVAIATALMPPLCTAGFGLANGQWIYFIGALYLFFINTVFIAIATYIIVRFMKFRKKVFLDKARERKVKNYMILIVIITIVPSVFMAYNIVQNSIFEGNADRFVESEFRNFEKTQVIGYTKEYKKRKENSHIDIVLVGEPLPENFIENIRARMVAYGLHDTELNVKQSDGSEQVDINTLQTSYMRLLDEKNRRINELSKELSHFTADTLALTDIAIEAGQIFDNVKTIALSRENEYDMQGKPIGKVLVAVVSCKNSDLEIDRQKLINWLAVRTKTEKVKLYVE